MSDVFNTLNHVNVNEHIEKKNGLSYLSWAWAWGEVKKRFPAATYTIYEDAGGKFYHTDGKTCWVKTGVTIDGLEHVEYLPVMDFKNKSIPVDQVTSFDVNKAIQRSLTKACARHGLGLYVYAGEDLPEESVDKTKAVSKKAPARAETADKKAQVKPEEEKQLPDKYITAIKANLKKGGIDENMFLKHYGKKTFKDLSMDDIHDMKGRSYEEMRNWA